MGKENVTLQPNTLLLSNHQTMIDSFLVGMCAFYPTSLYRPSLIPWNPAAEENFFKTPLLAWLAKNWKCIPIKKGRKDAGALKKMAQALKTGTLTIFPEGTRSRDGSIGKGKGGSGFLILECHPTVIPVCINGMDKVLPIGSVFPKFFKRIYVYFGKPLALTEFYSCGMKKEVALTIVGRVMESIRELRLEIEAIKEKAKQ
jgi:1-acyl-sn-glycerol-3-phosphate acyltransferase